MDSLSTCIALLIKAGAAFVIFNEVRGFVMAVPVLLAIYQSGGNLMAVWIGICALGGIALSVIVPLLAAKKLEALVKLRCS